MKSRLFATLIASTTILGLPISAQAQDFASIMNEAFNPDRLAFCDDVALGNNRTNNNGSVSTANRSSSSRSGGGGFSFMGIGANGRGSSSNSRSNSYSNHWNRDTSTVERGRRCSGYNEAASNLGVEYIRGTTQQNITEMQTDMMRDIHQNRSQMSNMNNMIQLYQMLQY